jgi:hypothetical protein
MAISAAVAAVVGTSYAVYSGEKAKSAQKTAIAEAKQNQAKSELAADQAMNRANPKKPNTNAALDQIAQSAKGGPSGTMLTGPTGVDPTSLNLGRSTLLGGGG